MDNAVVPAPPIDKAVVPVMAPVKDKMHPVVTEVERALVKVNAEEMTCPAVVALMVALAGVLSNVRGPALKVTGVAAEKSITPTIKGPTPVTGEFKATGNRALSPAS